LGLDDIVHDLELIAGRRHAFQTEHLDRGGGTDFLDALAAVIHQGAHFAGEVAGDKRFAYVERAVLNEHRGYGAASAI
jgi:hypothetical protein